MTANRAALRDGERLGRRVGLVLLILFYLTAGIGHFAFTRAMVRIVPDWVPWPHAVVIATGLCELAGSVGLMTHRFRRAAGWAFAVYAVCVFPANIHHAAIDLSRGTGLPLWYHLPRLLLQPALVWWALWASGAVGERRTMGGVSR